ncbi:hypothetical protein F4780DRAFT_766104 [Xylariomycetidae sp. FL0641]|nr:hypothetical protein F4780DRAFT_766104 [Xylariomycetidae sp. FL0641]
MSPARTLADVDHFEPVAPSKEPIDFAELHTIDLSQYDKGPEARRELASLVKQAMTTKGFFVVKNHGLSEEEITRQVDIGHTILKRTSLEEKLRLRSPILEKGTYLGFKPKGVWSVGGDRRDRIEQFNIARDTTQNEQPSTLEPYREEVQNLMDFIHNDILVKLLKLFGMALELDDPDYLVKLHAYDKHDESWLRYMEYEPIHDERDEEKKSLWLNGHKDFGSLSLLFSQPMTSLQVRDEEAGADAWKYIAHEPGAIIVNAGETMRWWTGDYFKAAIHRVVEPPRDQMGHGRSGVFYFAIPNDEVVINTLLDRSPLLRGAGVAMAHAPGDAPTSKEWANGRIVLTAQTSWGMEKDGEAVTEKVGKVTTTWFK